MVAQLNIDFSQVLHRRENSRSNEVILNDQKVRLSNQCRIVYELLKDGKRLTVRDAMIQHGIGDLRRRCADLRESGVNIKSLLIDKRFKEYFL